MPRGSGDGLFFIWLRASGYPFRNRRSVLEHVRAPHKIAVRSVHRCANNVHINEQVMVPSASLFEI